MQQQFDKDSEEFLRVDFRSKRKHANGKIVLLTILTGNQFVIYAPSLNLSGYGDTEIEATSMFFVALNDYFVHLSQLNGSQVLQELKEYGWARRPYLAKQLRNIKFIDEKAIIEDFDLPAETPIKRKLVTV